MPGRIKAPHLGKTPPPPLGWPRACPFCGLGTARQGGPGRGGSRARTLPGMSSSGATPCTFRSRCTSRALQVGGSSSGWPWLEVQHRKHVCVYLPWCVRGQRACVRTRVFACVCVWCFPTCQCVCVMRLCVHAPMCVACVACVHACMCQLGIVVSVVVGTLPSTTQPTR